MKPEASCDGLESPLTVGGGAVDLVFMRRALPIVVIAVAGCAEATESPDEESERLGQASLAVRSDNILPDGKVPGTWAMGEKGDTFFSQWDNPPLELKIPLRPGQETDRKGDSSLTQLYQLVVEHDAYDLDVMARKKLVPRPARNIAAHEAHGLLLRTDMVERAVLYRDDWDLPDTAVGVTTFELDPALRLVRVRVVELYADPSTTPDDIECPTAGNIVCGQKNWIGELGTRVVFEDHWFIDLDRTTNPQELPSQVVTTRIVASKCSSTETCYAPRERQPDRIFDACAKHVDEGGAPLGSIQFQIPDAPATEEKPSGFEYYSCEVPWAAYQNAKADGLNDCRATGNIDQIDAAVQDCGVPAAKAGVITVIYVGSLTNPRAECQEDGFPVTVKGVQTGSIFNGGGGGARVYLSALGHDDDLALAHELGHALGLADRVIPTEGEEDNLMNIGQSDGPALTEDQCRIAYTYAAEGHDWWPTN